ncbi:MAG: tyrosine-type recombinase/integrase [Bifidobacterium tsurumiense]|uniref:tyrosine-type recombinase/integrase n=1 Tax=Bifidobacterium tsurumiense TaxID=356829 RepID=UPI002A82BA3A|nr:tyrosine-type recombinase/integrase [Bifidobacterium tsurumiense]MDY4677578.1 tyrosine-type recombinase/integrase [Bifidobacterium tsurumiense]
MSEFFLDVENGKTRTKFPGHSVVGRAGFKDGLEEFVLKLREFHDVHWQNAVERLRECTRAGYESAWNRHIEPSLAEIDMDDLSVERVESWLSSIPSKGAARKAWSVLRAMLRKAIKWGFLDVDITRRIDAPKRAAYQPATLNARELNCLLRGFWGHELEAWLICSICLGLRTEEALGLDWEDIDLRSGKVHVRRGLQWINGHEVVVEPKTELSRRTVILPRFAILRLRQLKGRGRLVGTLNPGQVARRYVSWCKQHDLPCVPRRNLRHSWATTALAAGVDVAVVSRALGHSSIETTAKYYLRPDLSVLKDAQKQWEHAIMQ